MKELNILKEQIEKLQTSIDQKNQKEFNKKQNELEKEVKSIQKDDKKSLTEIKSEKFTELTYDIIFDLFNVADELLKNMSEGRVGQNLNLKLLQLYNRIVNYRKEMVKGLALVKNEDRLDSIQIRKDLKKNFNTHYVKLRNNKTKNRLKNF